MAAAEGAPQGTFMLIRILVFAAFIAAFASSALA
jgi:hypothetical protein